jgi:hypothetical protein
MARTSPQLSILVAADLVGRCGVFDVVHNDDVGLRDVVRRRQNSQAVAPFVDLVAIRNIRWDKGLIRHPAIVGALPFVR